MSRNEPIKITCKILEERDSAIKVNDGNVDAWLPRSMIKDIQPTKPNSDVAVVVIPEWLALKKGLI